MSKRLSRGMAIGFAALFLITQCVPAFSQVVLTGAYEFSTDANGNATSDKWNTHSNDAFNLWLARNPDGSLPLNGPDDSEASISIPLQAGASYTFYTFGEPGFQYTYDGLNLFFDENDVNPGISAFAPINSSAFVRNRSDSTVTLTGSPVPGSGTTYYHANDTVVVLSAYSWNGPNILNVCQAFTFAPGGAPDYTGSFTLDVYPSANLTLSQTNGSPGTPISVLGSNYTPFETVEFFASRFGVAPLGTALADANGNLTFPARIPQASHGSLPLFAFGQSSGKLGTAAFSVIPAVSLNPKTGNPGDSVQVSGVGFGIDEAVDLFWDNPRQFLNIATSNAVGSFLATHAETVTIPLNAPAGAHSVIAVGQNTQALGIGQITVK